ncbi:hypothetical protein EUGRSUZ_D00172 [Eucalyptus grandis]|uniref:Uncharacterized protein n=2 Tax=Eucalyptus grandis TaxID=71139 RepID=A0ACC3L263_EUCGR|nr:hypothetical protein EUGRSUZ_D00172 [Eucalyptus grandis]
MIKKTSSSFLFFHFHEVITHGYTSHALIATTLVCLALRFHCTAFHSCTGLNKISLEHRKVKIIKDLVIHHTNIVGKSGLDGLMSCHSYVPKI